MANNERDERDMDINEQPFLYEEEKVYEGDTFGERLAASDDDTDMDEEEVVVEEDVIVAEAVPSDTEPESGFKETLKPDADEQAKARELEDDELDD